MLKKLIDLLKRTPIYTSIRSTFVFAWQTPAFIRDYRRFNSLQSKCSTQRFSLKLLDIYPCLTDKTANTSFDAHYLYHIAWATRKVAKIKPEKHIDFSSHLYFSSMLSAFVNTEFYDYRPANITLSGLLCSQADLVKLPLKDNSVLSASCMHVVEHIGLGRYGDPIDPSGDIKAINELRRIMAPEGDLLFVVPTGQPKVMFNGHRIYSYDQILSYFPEFDLLEFSMVPDDFSCGVITSPSAAFRDSQTYACGMFWFRKRI